MPKLWLTYAWKDNEDADVDFVIQSLEAKGIDVAFDRVQLLTGKRLWDQIDQGITSPSKSDAWAIFVTENSLRSEPCLEELAFALDRALRSRGGEFPLIGIFPQTIDRELIPSAIATRLWVHLRDPNWADRIASDLKGEAKPRAATIDPYVVKFHQDSAGPIVEFRPRAGRWYPAFILLPESEHHLLRMVSHGPSGILPMSAMTSTSQMQAPVETTAGRIQMQGVSIHHDITNTHSMFAYLFDLPSQICFGSAEDYHCFKRQP